MKIRVGGVNFVFVFYSFKFVRLGYIMIGKPRRVNTPQVEALLHGYVDRKKSKERGGFSARQAHCGKAPKLKMLFMDYVNYINDL